ncbi:site-specific DNA-methyltransferase (adenine-specific) [Kibdelosporangium banguiense]|uniref:Methyltransferase n=1 Tax=Kibdelosporangium banguiense TaxID=1365924 RepID=A0ABS4U3K7_9PSEU|nr:site-specific DNA-methyltransferase [Kibdelosporangium banguiense]MBP2331249.1 site-specific DNA-methyltransferase (adenine-specific) [Kibdelosporangium banguiense]
MTSHSAEMLHGDALAVLSELPTASVDALITDPPYSSGGFTRGDRTADPRQKYLQDDYANFNQLATFAGDNRDQRGYLAWCALWLAECLRVVKPGGAAVVFTDWRQLPITTDALQAGGWVWRGVGAWSKPDARPQPGRFRQACEFIVWGSAGPMPIIPGTPPLPGWWSMIAPRDRVHITQKPLDVMRDLVKIAPPGGVVLDPFAGAGTTGIAAVLEGRSFVGIENTAHYHRAAAERIADTLRGYRTPDDQLTLTDVSEVTT